MSEIAVEREGQGPEVVLVHGGATPRATWDSLLGLARRWTLIMPYRRGFAPSPVERQDFEADALDLAPLLSGGVHLVAHSYGGLGSLIAAARGPASVRSLAIIEVPLFYLAEDDPDVAELQRLGDEFLSRGLESDPVALRAYMRIAGVEEIPEGPLPERMAAWVRRATGGRLAGEARPDLEALRGAGVPSLVASGGHSPANERICDALASELRAERLVVEGAGHFVQRDRRFLERLVGHLEEAESRER
jgi:pimeloyl-ACP methyl ester carboxylesterase